MAKCSEFVCLKRGTCLYESTGCVDSCLIALDIYKCHGCMLHNKCPIERAQTKENKKGLIK